MKKSPIKNTASPKETVEIIDCVQNSEEWLEARRGLITSSNFKIVRREGKDGGESSTRRDLLYKLAGEILSGKVNEGFKSEAMKRGNAMEAEIRGHYERGTFDKVRKVGFVKRTIQSAIAGQPDLVVGASPDALVGDDGGLEIKSVAPHLLIAQIESGIAPTEHRIQIHGTMWVVGLEWIDLKLGYTGMKLSPKYRFFRDEALIKEIRNDVERFDYDLKQLVKKMKAMEGAP